MTVTDITCYNDMERILVESVPYLVVAKWIKGPVVEHGTQRLNI